MTATPSEPRRVWTVAEAKARLSGILRLAEKVWRDRSPRRKFLGPWLIENTPRGTTVEIPNRKDRGREIPFTTAADE